MSYFLFRDISALVADIPSQLWQRPRSFRLLCHSTVATVLAIVCRYRTLRHIKAFALGLIFCNKCVYAEWKCVLHCFYGAVVFFFFSHLSSRTCQLCVNKRPCCEILGEMEYIYCRKKNSLEVLAAMGLVSHWFHGLEIVGY